jgi:hypothetical protein
MQTFCSVPYEVELKVKHVDTRLFIDFHLQISSAFLPVQKVQLLLQLWPLAYSMPTLPNTTSSPCVFKSFECGSDRQHAFTITLVAASGKKPANPPFYSGRAQRREKVQAHPLIEDGNVSGLVRTLEILEGGCIVR